MLFVYTVRCPRPSNVIDLSTIALDTLADTVTDICHHQTNARLWFGYLDGWMLTPQDEVRIRRALRQFDCFLMTAFPLSLPFAWKNEINTLYTTNLNGDPNPHDNGRAVHDGNAIGYGGVGS